MKYLCGAKGSELGLTTKIIMISRFNIIKREPDRAVPGKFRRIRVKWVSEKKIKIILLFDLDFTRLHQ
jgi:hypothetical protein